MPKTSPASSFLVVGAGISGLYAALLLARAGRRVRIIERSSRAGGLAAAEFFRGIPCDIGSHRLHRAALELPLFREIHAKNPFLLRPRRGVLLFGGHRLAYPPNALEMLSALGPSASLSLGVGLLSTGRRGRAFARWEHDRVSQTEDRDVGFERFVIDRVGEPAYRAFYRPYAEKVWGIDPAELSQSVAKKRLSTTRPWALLQNAFGRMLTKIDAFAEQPEDLDHFLYPAKGVSSMIQYLEKELTSSGVSVEMSRPFCIEDAQDNTVFFAGDLKDIVETGLEHRGAYLIYLALPLERAGPHETYYSPDPRYWFGRVSELKHYSPELSNPSETILCVEIPEGGWGRGVDFASGDRFQTLLSQLCHAGIIRPGTHPTEWRQCFVPQVYPLYRRGFRASWRDSMRRVIALGSMVPFGRQALFLHCNLDHCVQIAEAAVQHVLAGQSARGWVDRAERYLELRVRD